MEERNIGQAAIPPAFFDKMKGLLGGEFPAFRDALQSGCGAEEGRSRALRVNTDKLSAEEFMRLMGQELTLRAVPWAENGFYYGNEERPGRHPYHFAGLYYIQEPSAMIAAALSGVTPGERVLDLCAAPGGKSTAAAAMMKGSGLLVSNEIMPLRAKVLSSNIERMGIAHAVVTNEDSGKLAQRFPEFFDRIFVDAPCSGEGMFRKEEAARTDWSPENVDLCARRQKLILEDAARMLCDGGILVYSTCTFSPEEDEEQAAAFLDAHPEFHAAAVLDDGTGRRRAGFELMDEGHPEWIRDAALRERTEKDIRCAVRLWPHRLEGEGHFLIVLKKDGETADKVTEDAVLTADRKSKKLVMDFLDSLLTKTGKKHLGTDRKDFEGRLIRNGEEIWLLPARLSLSGIRVLRSGLDLGTVKKDRFEPAHALALFLRKEDVFSSYAMEPGDPQMLGYLKGNTVIAEDQTERKGFTLLLAGEFPVGWTKAAGGVLKNHYPRGLRIMG